MSPPKVHDIPTALAMMKAAPMLLDACLLALNDPLFPPRPEVAEILRMAIAEALPPPPPRPPGPFVLKATKDCDCDTCRSLAR